MEYHIHRRYLILRNINFISNFSFGMAILSWLLLCFAQAIQSTPVNNSIALTSFRSELLSEKDVADIYNFCGARGYIFVNTPYLIFSNSFYDEYRTFNILDYHNMPSKCTSYISKHIKQFPQIKHLFVSLNENFYSHMLIPMKKSLRLALDGNATILNLDFTLFYTDPVTFYAMIDDVSESKITQLSITGLKLNLKYPSKEEKSIHSKLSLRFKQLAKLAKYLKLNTIIQESKSCMLSSLHVI